VVTDEDDDALYDAIGLHVVPQLLYVAAKLGLADHLHAGPLDLASLVERTGAHRDSLARVLRALISLGLLSRSRAGAYRLERAGEPLLREHPRTRRAAILYAGELQQRAWTSVMHAVQTGESAFEHAFGRSMAEHLAVDDEAMTMIEVMRARRNAERNRALAEVLPLARVQTLADVGGGLGELLAELLGRHTRLRGVLIELPSVAARARTGLSERGLADRVQVVDADAQHDELPDADASVLVEVVHCMDDASAAELLRRCPGQTVYVAERVLPSDGRASPGHLADLHMLVMFGGRERTRREFGELFKSAGLQLRRVLQTNSWVSVLVATRPKSWMRMCLTAVDDRTDDRDMKKQAPKAPKAPSNKDSLRKDVLRVITHIRAGGDDGGDGGRDGDG
jgi:SAM-dependent methyltransferase